MGCQKSLIILIALFWIPFSVAAQSPKSSTWQALLEKDLKKLEEKFPNKLGLYVKSLSDQTDYTFRGDELWYIASGVKLPIAIEVLRQVDQKKLSLHTKITLTKDDYVDGAGSTNHHKAGTQFSVIRLLEEMMIHSDNTASDLLIKQVGLDPINIYLQEIIPSGFEKITTLAEVRRRAYGEIHPSAKKLSSGDLLILKSIPKEKDRLKKLQEILKLKDQDLLCEDLGEAFNRYYSQNLNSATLRSYGNLLQQILTPGILTKDSRNILLAIMQRTQTGKKRIRAGLPPDFRWAHKTGTQRQRICDFGITWKEGADLQKKSLVIAACVRDFKTLKQAESILKSVSASIYQSGVLK